MHRPPAALCTLLPKFRVFSSQAVNFAARPPFLLVKQTRPSLKMSERWSIKLPALEKDTTCLPGQVFPSLDASGGVILPSAL